VAPALKTLRSLFGGKARRAGMLDGFVASLIQSFENFRLGLSDEALKAGERATQAFFLAQYEKEVPRLRDTIRLVEIGVSEETRQDAFGRVDELIRAVVVPAYARLAARFTDRERNDFYLVPEPLHGLERLGWGAAGIVLGAFAVWAPFIPLWEKEWILPFAIAGLFLPNIRRYLALRRYQSELNALVARADDEIWRMDLAYMTGVGLSAEASGATGRSERLALPSAGTSVPRGKVRS
jgi:pilus assembly protein TadC